MAFRLCSAPEPVNRPVYMPQLSLTTWQPAVRPTPLSVYLLASLSTFLSLHAHCPSYLWLPDSLLSGQTPLTVRLLVRLSTFFSLLLTAVCPPASYSPLACLHFRLQATPISSSIPISLFSACCLPTCLLQSTCLFYKPQLSLPAPVLQCFHPVICPLALTVHLPVYLFVCKSRLFLSIPVPLCFQPVVCSSASYSPLACLPFRLQATTISTCTCPSVLSVCYRPTCLLPYICLLTCPLSCLRFPSIYVCLPDTTFYVPFFLSINLISPVTFPPLPLSIMFASANCQLLSHYGQIHSDVFKAHTLDPVSYTLLGG
jgi:hypothetical protein